MNIDLVNIKKVNCTLDIIKAYIKAILPTMLVGLLVLHGGDWLSDITLTRHKIKWNYINYHPLAVLSVMFIYNGLGILWQIITNTTIITSDRFVVVFLKCLCWYPAHWRHNGFNIYSQMRWGCRCRSCAICREDLCVNTGILQNRFQPPAQRFWAHFLMGKDIA